MHRLNKMWNHAGKAMAVLGLGLWAPAMLWAQIPQMPPGQKLPTAEEAQRALQNQPQLVTQLRQRLLQSGLTPDQVRSRLRAAGYPENMLDQYLTGADTTRAVKPGARTLDAVRSLGILSDAESDSLQVQDSMRVFSDSLQQLF